MKTFIFYKQYVGRGKTEITIHRIIKNKPVFVGRTSYNDNSTPGAISEALQYLINNRYLPLSYYYLSENSWRGNGYYCKEVEQKGVKITEI